MMESELAKLVKGMSFICGCCTPEEIVKALIGVAWDEEHAGEILRVLAQ